MNPPAIFSLTLLNVFSQQNTKKDEKMAAKRGGGGLRINKKQKKY
jgi:hypothetical protein